MPTRFASYPPTGRRAGFSEFLAIVILLLISHQSVGQTIPLSSYSEMRWRLVGPFRAGWATVAAGVPGEPNTLYFGAAGGGVWRSNDAGVTWQPLLQHEKASSIGALAVAPSNPAVIYAATGQVTVRYDILSGNGVYRSDDAGKSWTHVGLDASEHCGALLIDPHDPDRVLVAAMGNAFGPNPERGVFLTLNGGKDWRRVLYHNDSTGAVDLAQDPDHPSVVFAALWQMQQHPWLDYFQGQRGSGSGIYRSDDSGEHWKLVTGKLFSDSVGRIGLAVARGSQGRIVYATINASGGAGGLFRSADAGESWERVNAEGDLANDYFSHITVAPDDPNTVYVMGRSIRRSTDGGRDFTFFKGAPGGDDYHFLWINPVHPSYMITASDQGAAVSVNGGESWSDWYNQPTGQFYHLGADERFPYRIYSGQQDNGTVSISSRGPYGVIEERDWRPAGGDERGYEIPKPGDPDIVIGSGLGGFVSRVDEATHQAANVSPWPVPGYGARPTTVRYHYTWITPIEYSPIGSHALYFGAQVLFRSTDDGDQWSVASPDLSGKKPEADDCGIPGLAGARDCGFGTIFSIAPSPLRENIVWVGTDDGLVHLTKDGCKTWTNVTPADAPAWGLISAVAPSCFSEAAAYVAVDLHRLGRSAPLILKTVDNGRSWRTIIRGLPPDEYTYVVREDPVRKGLLFAGTNCGVYVSFDDGEDWQPLSLDLPTTSVRDLLIHDNDLIAATQGRGIWILDNIEPLRELSGEMTGEPVHLFQPSPAWRLRANENHDTPPPPSTPLGQNPPAGAIIDYWLREQVHGRVTMTVTDSVGDVVRQFSSSDKPEQLHSNRYFESGWLGPESSLLTAAGMHRFVWDLRYPRPAALTYEYSIAAVWQHESPLEPEGALVLPGRYTVALSVNSKEYHRPLVVRLDPRVITSPKHLREQLSLSMAIDSALKRVVSAHNTLGALLDSLKKDGTQNELIDSLSLLRDKDRSSLSSIAGVLAGLFTAVQSSDGVVTEGERMAFAEYRGKLDELMKRAQRLGVLQK